MKLTVEKNCKINSPDHEIPFRAMPEACQHPHDGNIQDLTLHSQTIANGHTLEEPKTILKEGYVFAGWYTDDELTNAYNFDDRVTDSFTLYAAWEKPEFKEPYNKQIVLPIKIIEKAIEFVKSVVK